MSIQSIFSKLWRSDAVHYTIAHIPGDRHDKPFESVSVVPEKHYIRLWLSEMFLKDDRKLLRSYVPVVHSAVTLQFGDKPAQELPYVAGPQNLGLGQTLGRGVQLNHALTNLLPFRGGMVRISSGLVAYKSKDYFKEFTDVLGNVAGLLNVGQLSTALKVVDTAVSGIQNLIGGGDKDVHLLFYGGFGGNDLDGGVSLKSGYTAVIRAEAGKLDDKKMFIKNSQLHYGDSKEKALPLGGYDYMLLRLEVTTGRDDARAFETFRKLLVEAIKLGFQDREHGDKLIDTIKVLVWESPDLTTTDRYAVAKSVIEEYKRALQGSEADAESRAAVIEGESSMKKASSFSKAIETNREFGDRMATASPGRPSLKEFLASVQS